MFKRNEKYDGLGIHNSECGISDCTGGGSLAFMLFTAAAAAAAVSLAFGETLRARLSCRHSLLIKSVKTCQSVLRDAVMQGVRCGVCVCRTARA